MTLKKCRACKRGRDVSLFKECRVSDNFPDGLSNTCIECSMVKKVRNIKDFENTNPVKRMEDLIKALNKYPVCMLTEVMASERVIINMILELEENLNPPLKNIQKIRRRKIKSNFIK